MRDHGIQWVSEIIPFFQHRSSVTLLTRPRDLWCTTRTPPISVHSRKETAHSAFLYPMRWRKYSCCAHFDAADASDEHFPIVPALWSAELDVLRSHQRHVTRVLHSGRTFRGVLSELYEIIELYNTRYTFLSFSIFFSSLLMHSYFFAWMLFVYARFCWQHPESTLLVVSDS